MIYWEQVVEGLAVLMDVHQLHLVKLGHFLVAYVRRGWAEGHRLNRTDYPG